MKDEQKYKGKCKKAELAEFVSLSKETTYEKLQITSVTVSLK
jgi:hypothetical protein